MCLAIPGKVSSLFTDGGVPMGKVDFGGVIKEICLVYVPEIEVGDYALVHAGFAITRINESAAEDTLRTIEEMIKMQDDLDQADRKESANSRRDLE